MPILRMASLSAGDEELFGFSHSNAINVVERYLLREEKNVVAVDIEEKVKLSGLTRIL